MRAFTGARTGWLTVIQLPGCAPGRSAVEGAWASVEGSLGSHGSHGVTSLAGLEAVVRPRLRSIRRWPDLFSAFPGQAGPTLDPPSPWTRPFSLCEHPANSWGRPGP